MRRAISNKNVIESNATVIKIIACRTTKKTDL